MTDAARLEGNGAGLIRERALAASIQRALERVYLLDRVADVGDFLKQAPAGQREALMLRQAADGAMEVRLCLPALQGEAGIDTLCQIIEGVSHFVYLVERHRLGRESTQLELELQAEVDKWVVLAESLATFDAPASAALRARLYEQVAFVDDAATEIGERYRVANETANRFVRQLERDCVEPARFAELRSRLRRFFHFGQEEKLRLAHASR